MLKKRVAAPGRGKSGSYRTIVAYREGKRLVFLHGFAKNEKGNITPKEREALLALGDHYLALNDAVLNRLVAENVVQEVKCDGEESDS